jgi:septum site-determining protein MinC
VTARAYDIKSLPYSLLTLRLKQLDVRAIAEQIERDRARQPDLFREPVVVDLREAAGADGYFDVSALLASLHERDCLAVAVCNGSEAQHGAALASGAIVLQGGPPERRRAPEPEPEPEQKPAAQAPSEPAPGPAAPAQIVELPVRTGQRILSAGDLTVLGNVNPGAEVLAVGNIHVYGALRGRALAGIGGDHKARIFTRCMQAELVSIAGSFRVLDSELPRDIQGKAAQIHLDGERIVIAAL